MSNKIKLSQGFTLVELSIVIIIIGFLIAGISAGNSLIQSARLHAVISEMQDYQLAIISFKDRYNALPGDMPNAASFWSNCTTNNTLCNGNGNDIIQFDNGAGIFGVADTKETELFWRHLFLAGLITKGGTFTNIDSLNTPNTFANYDIGYPQGVISNSTYLINGMTYAFYPQGGAINPWFPNNKNALYLIKASQWPGRSMITPTQAKELDIKADDGLPLSGGIRSVPDPFECAINTNCDCISGSDYHLTSIQSSCIPSKAMD